MIGFGVGNICVSYLGLKPLVCGLRIDECGNECNEGGYHQARFESRFCSLVRPQPEKRMKMENKRSKIKNQKK